MVHSAKACFSDCRERQGDEGAEREKEREGQGKFSQHLKKTH